MKVSVLSLKEKTTQHWFSYFEIPLLTILVYFRLYDKVQLSINSTRALFHKYFLAMKY